MKRELRWHEYITININWFNLTTRSQVLTPLIIPLLVQQFVGEANKGSYTGMIRLWALMAALLIQALMGILSDRNTSKFGRRRPFIFVGVVFEVIVIILIGLSAQLEGMSGYWILFGLYILSMVGANISHAATQGLIPDIVSSEKKGLASGIKTLLELPLPLVFASFVVAGMIEQGNLWGAIFALITVMLVAMGLTMLVKEEPLSETPPPTNWTPFFRLLAMTGAFTAIILGSGWAVNQVIRSFGELTGTTQLLVSGITGLLGMGVAVFVGVLLSTAISLGDDRKNQKPFVWWVINRLAFLVGATNFAGFMVFFLQEKFPEYRDGFEVAGPAARITMFIGIFILLSAIPSGWLADKIGKKPLIVLAGLLAGVGAAIIVLAPDMTLTFVGASIAGAGVGFFYSANWALGTEIVPADRAGEFLGLSNLAGAGAGAVGAYIGGPIGDSSGYVLLMSIYGAMALFSIIAVLGIKME
ncbi:MAG: MFS transporter [Chloroflexota bacterium]